MSIDGLIRRTAEAVAATYDELDFSDCAGVLLCPYVSGSPEELAPLALELREGEVTPDVDRDGYQEELGIPDVPLEIGQELCDHVANDDDGYVLIERFWLVLAEQLHARIGIPVLVHDIDMPIAEQLRRQTGTPLDIDAELAGMASSCACTSIRTSSPPWSGVTGCGCTASLASAGQARRRRSDAD